MWAIALNPLDVQARPVLRTSKHPDLPIIARTNHGPVCLGFYRPEVLALNSLTPSSGFPHRGVNVATLQKGSSLPRINLVFHEDLPGIGVTNIDSCVIALPWPDAIFRDSEYLVVSSRACMFSFWSLPRVAGMTN